MTTAVLPPGSDGADEASSIVTAPKSTPRAVLGRTNRWGTGRAWRFLLLGIPLYLLAAICLVGGTGAVVLDLAGRDETGLLTNTDNFDLQSGGSAVVTTPRQVFEFGGDVRPFREIVGRVGLSVHSRGQAPIFIGVGKTSDVDRYLEGPGHGTPPERPANQSFWHSSAVGSGSQAVQLLPSTDDLSIVVMNADGSSGVAVDATIRVRLAALKWLGIVLIAFGVGIALVAAALFGGSPPVRGRGRHSS